MSTEHLTSYAKRGGNPEVNFSAVLQSKCKILRC